MDALPEIVGVAGTVFGLLPGIGGGAATAAGEGEAVDAFGASSGGAVTTGSGTHNENSVRRWIVLGDANSSTATVNRSESSSTVTDLLSETVEADTADTVETVGGRDVTVPPSADVRYELVNDTVIGSVAVCPGRRAVPLTTVLPGLARLDTSELRIEALPDPFAGVAGTNTVCAI